MSLVKGRYYRSRGNENYLYRITKAGPKQVTVQSYTLRREFYGTDPVTISRKAAQDLLVEVGDGEPE